MSFRKGVNVLVVTTETVTGALQTPGEEDKHGLGSLESLIKGELDPRNEGDCSQMSQDTNCHGRTGVLGKQEPGLLTPRCHRLSAMVCYLATGMNAGSWGHIFA